MRCGALNYNHYRQNDITYRNKCDKKSSFLGLVLKLPVLKMKIYKV